MSQQIVVTVRANGSVVAETRGITGPACADWIGPLEDLLEATTASSTWTADLDRAVERGRTDQEHVEQDVVEDERDEIHGGR